MAIIYGRRMIEVPKFDCVGGDFSGRVCICCGKQLTLTPRVWFLRGFWREFLSVFTGRELEWECRYCGTDGHEHVCPAEFVYPIEDGF